MSSAPVVSRVSRSSADGTRERILAAALDAFAKLSFQGASTRAIAERAAVTQPLLNYHFRSKDELWREVVNRLFADLQQALAAREKGLRGIDTIVMTKLLIREFVTYSARNPQLHQIVTGECTSDSERVDWIVDEHVRPLYDWTLAHIGALTDAGLIPRISPTHLFFLLIGGATTLFVLGPEFRRLTGQDPYTEAVIEAHADAILILLFGMSDTS